MTIAEHDLNWTGVTYARVPPGIYSAVAKAKQGPVWLRRYRRWSLRIEFELLDDCQRVSRFFNFGSNPEKPEIRRGSHYFKWWTAANGELPRRGQSMTPEVFFEGQVFRVSVEDASNDGEQQAKHDSEIYSRVTLLHEVSRPQSSDQPISQSSNHESLNHGIRNQSITESPNQVINQSSRPPARRKRKQETYY